LKNLFTFWVGPWLCGVETPKNLMVMYSRRAEVKIEGAVPAVNGIVYFPGPDNPVTIVDLRVLFDSPAKRTDGAALVLTGPDGKAYGLVFDILDTEFNFEHPKESEDAVYSLSSTLWPYVETVVWGQVGGVRQEVLRLDLAKILSPETLMVN